MAREASAGTVTASVPLMRTHLVIASMRTRFVIASMRTQFVIASMRTQFVIASMRTQFVIARSVATWQSRWMNVVCSGDEIAIPASSAGSQ